eukprot:3735603-Prymnesium_polylepis.1
MPCSRFSGKTHGVDGVVAHAPWREWGGAHPEMMPRRAGPWQSLQHATTSGQRGNFNWVRERRAVNVWGPYREPPWHEGSGIVAPKRK